MIEQKPGRFVAMGDSFTEGVGDSSKRRPNGVRGWADRVAEGLASECPGWEYANLAIRSKRIRHIVSEQLDVAIAMEPTLVTLYAGGNDVMDLGTKIPDILKQYEFLVARLAQSGATLVLFTGYDVDVSPILGPLRRKNHAYNDGVRRIAARHGAILIDYAVMNAFENPRMWSADRLHMSKHGHKYLAARVLEVLQVPHGIKVQDKRKAQPGLLRRVREHCVWIGEWVLPMLGRKLRGTTLGDTLSPRWPEPIRVPPKKGLKKLVK